MLIYALNFTFAVVLFSLRKSIHISYYEVALFSLLVIVFFATLKRYKPIAINIMIFLAGFSWMWAFSANIITNRVASEYLNKPIIVTGVIDELAVNNINNTKFIINVNKPFHAKLKLSWYAKHIPELKTGDSWQLLIKLKANNGSQNIGGFDYEKWLFYNKIDAGGYVKDSVENKLTQQERVFSVDSLRFDIRDLLTKYLQDLQFGGVINALAIGDRSLISDVNWEIFQATNTTHLVVISGLHIGLIAGFAFLLSAFLWRRCSILTMYIPAQIIGAYVGIVVALMYALIAGFSIPTIRAMIMLSVLFISIILRRNHDIWQLYGVALLLVVASNPVSVFSIGFWLSFYVVAIIIYASKQCAHKSWLYSLIYIQLVITLATIPVLAWFFTQGSVLSPIANLVAIPVFSFIVTPLALIGAICAIIGLDSLAVIIFAISNYALLLLSYLLNFLQQFSFNIWHYTQTSAIDLVLLVIAALIAILPRGLKFRRFGLIIIILVFFNPTLKPNTGEVKISVLDVGQGLSILVQTSEHNLLFDAGAAFYNGGDFGKSVIIPHLRAQKITKLDNIIISHGDNDHIGGLESIIAEFPYNKIISSAGYKIKHPVTACVAGDKWRWDGVDFLMLNPDSKSTFKKNNSSCVLKISTNKYSILLTADIEKKAERYLLNNYKDELASDVLLAPHHGSKTSSSNKFIMAVNPKFVIFSSGFNNRFHHPASLIVDRYKKHNVQTLMTNCAGQIDINLGQKIDISSYRKTHQRYYMRQCVE